MEYYELYHHGVKGQRWGVRRFQNSDGSLTPAGQKRRSLGQVIKDHRVAKKRKAALVKARATRAANQEAAKKRAEDLAKGRIKAKDMTPEELQSKLTRLRMEKEYNDLVKQQSSVSRGKRFIDKFLDSTTDRLADSVASDLVAQTVKSFLVEGINTGIKKTGVNEPVYTNNKKKS